MLSRWAAIDNETDKAMPCPYKCIWKYRRVAVGMIL